MPTTKHARSLNYSSVSIGLEVNLVRCSKEFSSDMGVLVKQM